MKLTALIIGFLVFAGVMLLPSHQSRVTKYHQTDGILKTTYTSNPPSGRTGAPGESNCTVSCHSGATQSAAGVIDITFSGAGTEYMVGQSYTITFSISTGTKNGFQATILDTADNKAGTFTSGTNYSISNSLGRQYARHSVSDGITTWTVNWTAPDADAGDLTLYYAFNKSNNMDNSGGDVIYLGQLTIGSALFNTVTAYESIDNQLTIWYDAFDNAVNFHFGLIKTSRVLLSVQDLNGRLIAQKDLGLNSPGLYEQRFELLEKPASGIYIVSMFSDNNVFNRKIYID